MQIGASSINFLSPGEVRRNNSPKSPELGLSPELHFCSARVWLVNAKGTIAKAFVIFTENSEVSAQIHLPMFSL